MSKAASAIHFRVRKGGVERNSVIAACNVAGVRMFSWRRSTWEKGKVTCTNCQQTLAFKEAKP